jgi:hypothetical protein
MFGSGPGDTSHALLLKRRIAHGEHFIDDKDLGFEVRRHGEREAHVHAAGVAFDGRVDEAGDLGEFDDFVEFGADLAVRHSQDRTIQVDVLAPGQFRMKARADFEQTGDAPAHFDAAAAGFDDATEDFQQRRFPGAVAADNTDDLAGLNFEGHVFEGPEFFRMWIGMRGRAPDGSTRSRRRGAGVRGRGSMGQPDGAVGVGPESPAHAPPGCGCCVCNDVAEHLLVVVG